MKKGTLIQGSLNVSQHNVLQVCIDCVCYAREKKTKTNFIVIQATIVGNVDGEPKTIYILGRKNMNRSIQGDIVAVELLPRDQWKKSTSLAVEDEEDEEKMHGEMDTIMSEANAMDKDEVGEPTGKVVGLIRKRWRP